jgi:hypothetical protein
MGNLCCNSRGYRAPAQDKSNPPINHQ